MTDKILVQSGMNKGKILVKIGLVRLRSIKELKVWHSKGAKRRFLLKNQRKYSRSASSTSNFAKENKLIFTTLICTQRKFLRGNMANKWNMSQRLCTKKNMKKVAKNSETSLRRSRGTIKVHSSLTSHDT